MTVFIIFILLVVAVGGAGVAHPRTRHLFLQENAAPKTLPSHSSAEVEQWKQIFRETVISADGSLSREMEEFLMNDDERVTVFLAQARIAAEKDRAAILKKAEEERAELLKENEDWAASGRPLLIGAAYKEYQDDMDASKSSEERGKVIRRWHNKGFRFSRKLRGELLKNAVNDFTRNGWRKLFDEQDE